MAVEVKICGLTNFEDAQAAARAGADLLGFIFYPRSVRYVTPEKVREILQKLDRPKAKTVGVFVNQTVDEVQAIMHMCGLDYAQLHGNESPDMVRQSRIDGKSNPLFGRSYKAIKPRTVDEGLKLAAQYANPAAQDEGNLLPAFLLDTYDPIQPGGTGQLGDKQIALELANRYAILLAGGLTVDNLQPLLKEIKPWGVDVAGGTEAAPGIKDHTLVERFIHITKETRL
jgi:phosphoribosylanthranilate isomerase